MGYRYFISTLIAGLAVSYFLVNRTTIGENKIAVSMLAMWFLGMVGVYTVVNRYKKKKYKGEKEQSNKSL